MVKQLISRGADVNVQDTFYQMRAVDMAMMNNHVNVVTLLLERGSKGAAGLLPMAIQRGNVAIRSQHGESASHYAPTDIPC